MLPASRPSLAPISNPIYNNGDPIVMLSPSGSERNARIIYEAIRHCDQNQRMRAAYTELTKPYLAFVSKQSCSSRKIKAYNILQQRRELMNILCKTCDSGLSGLNLTSAEKAEILKFRNQMQSGAINRDLKVKDIIQVMTVLATRGEKKQIRDDRRARQRALFSPTSEDLRRIETKRITQFLQEGRPTRELLRNALARDHDKGPEVAADAVKALVSLFVRVQTTRGAPLKRITISRADNENLKTFADRWTYLRNASTRGGKNRPVLLCDRPWSLLLDKVAEIVINAARTRTSQVSAIDGSRHLGRAIHARSVASSDVHSPAITPAAAHEKPVNTSPDPADESDVLVASPVQNSKYLSYRTPAPSPMTVSLRGAETPSGAPSLSPGKVAEKTSDMTTGRLVNADREATHGRTRKGKSMSRSSKSLGKLFQTPIRRISMGISPTFELKTEVMALLNNSPSDEWFDNPAYSSPTAEAKLETVGKIKGIPDLSYSPVPSALQDEGIPDEMAPAGAGVLSSSATGGETTSGAKI